MNRTVMIIVLAVVCICVTLPGPSLGMTVIDTATGWATRGTTVGTWGQVGSATFGQVFTVGADTRLDSFTFPVSDGAGVALPEETDFVGFGAYVMAWGGSHAQGPTLFDSGPLTTTNNGGLGGWEWFAVDTGGIELSPGQQYVAFFSVSEHCDDEPGGAWLGYAGDHYDGGQFVYLDNGTDFDATTTTDWYTWNVTGDIATVISFNVPSFPGDLNDDGWVGHTDLGIVLDWWGQTVTPGVQADPTGDGFVGQFDLDTVLDNWGEGTPPTAPVPAPATLMLLVLGGFAALRRLG